jgi:glycyl-tRNA synthetase
MNKYKSTQPKRKAVMTDHDDNLRSVAKRVGFFHQTAENYGGEGGLWTLGPHGTGVKRRIENDWRQRFTVEEGHVEIEAPTVMGEAVFEASGHLDGFDDMLVECPQCGQSERADHIVEDNTDIEEAESLPNGEVESLIAEHDLVCPECGTELAGQSVIDHNLMFETSIGPGNSTPGFLRPETAQGIFADFHRLKQYENKQLPFAVTQIGRSYRNEISPRGGLERLREFTQAELEHFIDPAEHEPDLEQVREVPVTLYPSDAQQADDGAPFETTIGEAVEEGVIADPWIAYYIGIAKEWYVRIGIDPTRLRFRQHQPDERAHYASDCWDAETEINRDWLEVTGFADRGSYDLRKHGAHTGDETAYQIFRPFDEPRTEAQVVVDPDMSVIGPEFGEQADAIKQALERKGAADPSAFDGDTVTVELDDGEATVSTELVDVERVEVTKEGDHEHPKIIEPSFGIDRIVYSVLHHALEVDAVPGSDDQRTVMSLDPVVAPTLAAVLPLRDTVDDAAREVADELRSAGLPVEFDAGGRIGRRYRRQDEAGTPFCVTVDPEEVVDGSVERVTIRDRDSTAQVWVPVEDLAAELTALQAGAREFDDLLEAYQVRTEPKAEAA